MTQLSKTLLLAAAALGFTLSQADAFVAKRQGLSAPPASYQGQWYTAPDGCSYSRASAPGYGTMWVLIRNPHHIGQPNATRQCTTMLQAGG